MRNGELTISFTHDNGGEATKFESMAIQLNGGVKVNSETTMKLSLSKKKSAPMAEFSLGIIFGIIQIILGFYKISNVLNSYRLISKC